MCKLWINLPALASVPLFCLEVPFVPNLHSATGLTVYQGNTKAMTIYQGNTPKIQWVAWSCLHVGVRWMGYAPSVLDMICLQNYFKNYWWPFFPGYQGTKFTQACLVLCLASGQCHGQLKWILPQKWHLHSQLGATKLATGCISTSKWGASFKRPAALGEVTLRCVWSGHQRSR